MFERRDTMPTYITLANWTDQGIRNVKESSQRLDAARKAVEAAGGKWLGFYMTMGRYDMVVIIEAPGDEVASAVLLAIGSGGSIRTETMRAYPEAEYRKIIAGLP
jgi:uncharacterized protein with GYD domain